MIPVQLQKKEFRFIKVRRKNKIPLEQDWVKKNNYVFDNIGIQAYIKNGGNYGVATGFGNLVVIDSDHKNTQKLVEEKLPDTFRVSTGKGTHNYFICKDLKQKIVLDNDTEGEHYGEVQTVGQQVVAPGSIHPNGHKYKVINDVDIVEVSKNQIKDCLKTLMIGKNKVAPEKTMFSVKEGSRNETLFKLACSLKSRNVPQQQALETLKNLNTSFTPPLDKREIENLTNSAYKYNFNNSDLKITNYIDNAKSFWEKQPFFYDKQKMFWAWNFPESKWEIIDETDIMNLIEDSLGLNGETVTQKVKGAYIEAFKRIGRKYKPEEAPKKWVQFKNKAFSLSSGKTYGIQPNYFFCNPIPWEIGTSTKTPTMDRLFEEWVGKDYVKTLYEIIAYCCYADYPIQTLFCFLGHGRNGKSQFQKLLAKFLGKDNICSTELDLLTNNRFESFKLYKKLACSMGETNFGVLTSTSLIKKLTGGDLIGFEKKNKDPFDDVNYAKIIINSNSLPSSEDTSEGFYRRWLIIDFPNQFKEGKDIISTIPEVEYKNLALKVCKILPDLLSSGEFYNQGSIDERKKKYIEASNPLSLFLNTYCHRDGTGYIRYGTLYNAYVQFLSKKKRRIVMRKELNQMLSLEGLETRRVSKCVDIIADKYERDQWVEGIAWNMDEDQVIEEICK